MPRCRRQASFYRQDDVNSPEPVTSIRTSTLATTVVALLHLHLLLEYAQNGRKLQDLLMESIRNTAAKYNDAVHLPKNHSLLVAEAVLKVTSMR